MMKLKRVINFLLAASILTTALCGCFPTEPIDYGDPSGPAGLDPPTKLTNDLIPEQYFETVGDNINISLPFGGIVVPDAIDFGTFTAKKNKFSDFDKIKELFISGEAELETVTDADGEINHYTAPDGSELTAFPTHIIYQAADTYEDYSALFHGGANAVFPNLRMFFSKTELDGIDREESIALVKGKLDELGIECEAEPTVYCIDYESTSSFLEMLIDTYGEIGELATFNADDEAYIIIFNQTFEGMPISYEQWYDSQSGLNYTPGMNYAVVSKKGLVYFRAGAGYTPTSEKQELEGLYNVDVIGKSLQDMFGEMKLSSGYNFTQARLEYVCVNETDGKEDGLEFEPYWVVCGTVSNNFDIAVWVNAATGELMRNSNLLSII